MHFKKIAIQTGEAIGTIEQSLGVTLPKVGRDKPLLHLNQLKVIADAVNDSNSATIPQRYLDAENLARDGATKQAIMDALLGGE